MCALLVGELGLSVALHEASVHRGIVTAMLRTISTLSILLFAVSGMLSAGLSFTFREVLAPLREPNRVVRALIGNFVLVPLLAIVLARVFSLDAPLALGLILLGTAAGTPFLIKLVAIAAADVALGTALLVLLVPITVVVMPIAIPLLVPEASVSAAAIAVPLALTMLLPLGVGLLVSESAGTWARRLQPVARKVSTVTLVVVLVSTLLVNLHHLGGILVSRAMLATLLFVVGSFVIGYVIASPRPGRRVVLGLGTAQRNIAAASVVAAEEFRGPDTLVLVVLASVLGLFVLIPVARALRGRMAR
jgi:predicted Na+-dependent transporter